MVNDCVHSLQYFPPLYSEMTLNKLLAVDILHSHILAYMYVYHLFIICMTAGKKTENHIKKIIVQGFKYEECKYNLTFPEFLSIQNNQDVQSVDENE